MLTSVLATQRAHFAAIAKSWLTSGASAFGVWSNGAALASWPDQRLLDRPSLAVPIAVAERVVGELRLVGLDDMPSHVRLTSEAGLVARLVEIEEELHAMTAELVDSQDRLLAVYQLARSLRYYTTIGDTLRGLLFETMRLVKTRGGFVVFENEPGEPTLMQYPAGYSNDAVLWAIYRQMQARDCELLLTSEHLLEHYGVTAENLCVIPMRVRGVCIAGLGLFNKPNGFSSPDVKLACAIIDQACVQIEQVLLHNETQEQHRVQSELALARRVQLRLLPQQLPMVTGLDIAARARPARQIGGDFYDFICQPQRPLFFTVGDVSGKALSAALLMAMTKTAIHSKAGYMPNPAPDLVMRNSNEDLFEDFMQVGMFATAFVGQYEAQSRQIIYANAGHSPVIYCPVGGEPRLLEADSPPLGVLRVSSCKNHTVRLHDGDVLVVATDGFNEACNPSEEMFGYERLLDLVAMAAAMPADAIADTLFAAVDEFGVGRPQDDDQTLVVIKGAAA